MALYEITQNSIVPIPATTFAAQGIRERSALQRLLRENITVIAPDTYVLAEEYGEWEDTKRRIDLLCLDKHANIVVVELKRTEDGGHMELQAIRYAAMVSKLTFAQSVEAHARFLRHLGRDDDAEAAILKFLEWDEPNEKEFAQETRIILVSGEFSKEITTSVLWLNERDLDVRCVRLRPYALGERTLLDIQQVLPLPEATEYQVQLRRKAAEERQSQEGTSDWSRNDLTINGQKTPNLYKRHLFFHIVRALIKHGVTPDSILEFLPERKLISVAGECSSGEFREKASELRTQYGSTYDLRRYFIKDDELLTRSTFIVSEILTSRVEGAPFGFAFDRGCFHALSSDKERKSSAENVNGHLGKDGLWLSLLGNADERRDGPGPPQRTARNIVNAVEPSFETQIRALETYRYLRWVEKTPHIFDLCRVSCLAPWRASARP